MDAELAMKQPKQAKPPAQPKQPRRYRDDDEVAAQAYAQANGYPQPTQDQQTDWQAAQSYNQHGEQPYTENAEPPYGPCGALQRATTEPTDAAAPAGEPASAEGEPIAPSPSWNPNRTPPAATATRTTRAP